MPRTFRINEVLVVLRKKLDMTKNETLMLFVQRGNKEKYQLVAGENSLTALYDRYKDPDDGMLYCIYA